MRNSCSERASARAALERLAEAAADPAAARALLADLPATTEGRPPVRRFMGRRYQPAPDRAASRERRRRLGGRSDSWMPPQVSDRFTEGERAVLVVIAFEVRNHGCCELAIDAIGAKAGCSRTTVHNALGEARRLGMIHVQARERPGAKNLTNVITIVSLEWSTWLKAGIGSKRPIAPSLASRFSCPTKTVRETLHAERDRPELWAWRDRQRSGGAP